MTRMRRDGFTLVELLVVIAIMGTLMSILLPAVQAVRESARKVTCKANLVQIVHSMQMFHDAHGNYPAGLDADKKATGIDPWFGHTGWVYLLNYLDARSVYEQYEFEFKSTDIKNEPARSQVIPSFLCPTDNSDRTVEYKDDGGEFSRSNYALCFGSETMAIRWTDKKTDGAFRVSKTRSDRDFLTYKGKTETVMASELIAGTKDKYTSNSYDLRGVWAYYSMGSFAYTHFQIPNSEEPDLMLFESGRKNCVDLPGMPCAEDGQANRFYAFRAAARSRHPGGVHVAYADERVEWVSDTIDLDTWRRKGSLAEKRLDEDDDDVEFKVRISDRF